MRKLILTIFTALLFSNLLHAQYLDYHIVSVMDYVRMNKYTSEPASKTLSEEGINGSPYLNDDFTSGTIYTTSKQRIEGLSLRFNAYNDNLEFKTDASETLAIDNPETIELADFGDVKMTYTHYVYGKKTNSGYFKILEQGKATLYAKTNVTFQKEVKGDGIRPDKPATFVHNADSYYIQIGDAPAERIDNKKALLSTMDDYNKEISAYLKDNKVKFTKSEHLCKLVQYYNSL